MSNKELSWRRHWKPDLMANTWQPLTIQRNQYFIKFHMNDDSYEILVNDRVHTWYEMCDCKMFKKRCKKLNPSIEAPVSRLLDHLWNNLQKQKKESEFRVEEKTSSEFVLSMNSSLAAGVPFTWKFNCQTASQDMISSNLTVPLLTMVSELQRRQDELFKLLQKKDTEIEDYKLSGAKVSRKHLETVPFDKTVFENEMNTSQSFEREVKSSGTSAFTSSGQDLYQQIMMKNAWLERDVEDEESDEDEEGVSSSDRLTSSGTSPSVDTSRLPPSYLKAQRSPSPKKSPAKLSPEKSPANVKDTELMRREALERRLAMEESKLASKKKKTKKGLF
ncbi:non-homologous end-joining factor 1-like [Ptychodera flava]|uniref:non-homologous end-joining factor 1-like n=1 Tax=Ptychodera flava TaxID=63121 RepID=UPI00396A8FB6